MRTLFAFLYFLIIILTETKIKSVSLFFSIFSHVFCISLFRLNIRRVQFLFKFSMFSHFLHLEVKYIVRHFIRCL